MRGIEVKPRKKSGLLLVLGAVALGASCSSVIKGQSADLTRGRDGDEAMPFTDLAKYVKNREQTPPPNLPEELLRDDVIPGRKRWQVHQRLPSAAQQVFAPVVRRHIGPRMEGPHRAHLLPLETKLYFAHRRAVIARSTEDAVSALSRLDARNTITGSAPAGSRRVAFMFPGLGNHYVNMARGLYDSAPVFREVFDQCCESLSPHLGLDLREVVYPARHDPEPGGRGRGSDPRRPDQGAALDPLLADDRAAIVAAADPRAEPQFDPEVTGSLSRPAGSATQASQKRCVPGGLGFSSPPLREWRIDDC